MTKACGLACFDSHTEEFATHSGSQKCSLNRLSELEAGGLSMMLSQSARIDMPRTNGLVLHLLVDDHDAAVKRDTAAGAKLLLAPERTF